MNSLKRILFATFFLLTGISVLSPISIHAQVSSLSPYRYAFVTDHGIGFLDPSAPEQTPSWYAMTTPSDDTLFSRAVASYDGHWIAVGITQRTHPTNKIQLFNVVLNAVQPPIQVGNGFPSEMDIMGWDWVAPAQEMVWSPDSRYLALNMLGPKQSEVYLYSIYDGRLTAITNLDTAQHYRMAWSNDSTYIATNGFTCAANGQCVSKIEYFDVQGHLVSSVTVSDISCDLGWSPDNRYIYFKDTCDSLSWSQEELFLWDTVQNTIVRITNYTHHLQVGDKAGPNAEYIVLWTNRSAAIISTFFSDTKTAATFTRTISYNVNSGSLTPLSDNLIQQFAVNPVSGQIVFREIAQADFDWAQPRNSITHLGQISNAALTELPFPQATQIKGGCDFAWSPDGKYLVYALPASCVVHNANEIDGFGFVESVTGSIHQRLFTLDDPIIGSIPAGWVITPGQLAGSQTPPPPVVLTPTALPATPVPPATASGLQD